MNLPFVTKLSEHLYHARGSYRCSVCGHKISPGERYTRFTCIANEELQLNYRFLTFRIHSSCPQELRP